MPTLKQKTAFSKMVEKVGKHENTSMGKIMLESGYTPAMAKNPQKLTNSTGFRMLLAQVEDKPLLERLVEMALGTDKRTSLDAIKTILIDLKGYGQEKTTKIIGLFESISNIEE
jgi:hypothetical protein